MRIAKAGVLAVGCSWLVGAAAPGERVPVEIAGQALALEVVGAGHERPLLATGAGDGSGRIYVVEQGGKIFRYAGAERELWLDLSSRVTRANNEQGLLGLAFPADFASSGRVFVSYTAPGGPAAGRTIVSRLTIDPATGRPDPSSEAVLFDLPQPAGNHNGGHIVFGPDRKLYFGLGDGGAANDRFRTSRDPTSLLAKLLRVDIDAPAAPGKPYAIPADNPFADGAGGQPEIWATGLRNPWRFSFDPATGDLWIGDVGQNKFEEVHVAPSTVAGVDYGWRVLEGAHCFDPAEGCSREGLALPVLEYGHDAGCSVTGGHDYRGAAIPALQGVYLAGDYCTGRLWSIRFAGWPQGPLTATSPALLDPRPRARVSEAGRLAANISSFGLDDAGELLVVHHGGTVWRLVPR
jgi:glucose/arabinose dehydrogenase